MVHTVDSYRFAGSITRLMLETWIHFSRGNWATNSLLAPASDGDQSLLVLVGCLPSGNENLLGRRSLTLKIGWLKANPVLDRLSFRHFFIISPSQPGSERVPIPDLYRFIAKLDLDDEALDHDPGHLDILPAERGI